MSKPTKTCPDCGGLPGINPKNRCPACQVRHNTRTPTQNELEQEVKAIADYLGCNGGELWSEMRKTIEAYANKRCDEVEAIVWDIAYKAGINEASNQRCEEMLDRLEEKAYSYQPTPDPNSYASAVDTRDIEAERKALKGVK